LEEKNKFIGFFIVRERLKISEEFVVIEDKEGNIEDNILGFDMSHPIIQFFIYNNMYIDRLDRSLVLKKD